MPTERGTRKDIIPKVETPPVTAVPLPEVNPTLAREFPELVNLQVPPKQEEPQLGNTAPNLQKTQIPGAKAGEFEYRIGGQVVSKADYENASLISKGEAGFVSPQLQQQMGGLGLQPFAEKQRLQQVASQLGLNEAQIQAIQSGLVEAPVEWGQALTAGGARVLPSALAGAGTGLAAGLIGAKAGAIAGTAITPGLGTAIGAGIGLLSGLTTGILANIKKQQKGQINKEVDVLTNAKRNMRQLSSLAAKDPSNAATYVEAYNQQLAQVYRAQRQIRLETQGNLNKFMEDGTDILSDFELFLSPSGQASIYRRQLELALMSGVEPSLTVEDFQ